MILTWTRRTGCTTLIVTEESLALGNEASASDHLLASPRQKGGSMRYRPILQPVLSTTASARSIFRVWFQGDKRLYSNTVRIGNLCGFRPDLQSTSETATRLGVMRSFGSQVEATRFSIDDPRFLVFLADQELEAGREEQAQALLDAAYAAFDRRLRSR